MTRARDIADGLGAESGEVVPHIKLDVLYPAVAGKDLSGTALGGSYVYGNAHTDGRKYYYTDIKGSKPIKDPRIGAYFGSQRHRASSIQLLEQETATHGLNVYSVDGREWFRAVGDNITQYNTAWQGNYIGLNSDDNFWEVTFYGIDLNWCMGNHSDLRGFMITVDGGTESAEKTPAQTTQAGDYTPNRNRYQDSGFLVNIGVGASLGIHTVKIRPHTSGTNQVDCSFMEIITQDTSSVANRSKIQIPAQTVISYGKKHSISATAQNYDPFNGMSGAKTLAQLGDYIDTATSLGMENWKGGTSNYHKPFNGGRVVKWVDSSGTIKTSVTMMPPNAQNISATASNAVSNAHIIDGTNDDTINFDTTTIANATPLSEVAKTYHWREFGNGSANGGTGASGSLADASMLNTPDDIAYVMEDGLTSSSADDCNGNSANQDLQPENNGDRYYYTFIGSGIGIESKQDSAGYHTFAQNLPYGTHILTVKRDSTHKVYLDGIEIKSGTLYSTHYVTFHQPKKPPVPEDACILADYMLMADYVKQTSIDQGVISKGVRFVSGGREHKYDTSGNTMTSAFDPANCHWGHGVGSGNAACTSVIPFFGTTGQGCAEGVEAADWTLQLGGSTVTHAELQGGSGFGGCDQMTTSSTVNLGLTTIGSTFPSGGYKSFGHLVVTPIHTSHHYQFFESPFLFELVGGDRNMEQTNLVVSPSGETWDKVTRDTSYIGNRCYSATADTVFNSSSDIVVFDRVRGIEATSKREFFNKDFAISYNRLICLVDGQYTVRLTQLSYSGYSSTTSLSLRKNGTIYLHAYHDNIDYITYGYSTSINLIRGDYLEVQGIWHDGMPYSQFQIDRIG